ncbi:MAG: hypothetical protein H0Z35_05880 [Thermoanaerobacteraceae bacterium]|nr:hypothetical protein [Thermoanaerobacteraceae bacterium]
MKDICKQKKSLRHYWKNYDWFAKFNLGLFVVILVVTIYLIIRDPGNLSNQPYGAGDYYYTDVEGFEKVFFGKGLGTNYPILFFSLFISWGLICWYFLKWIEKKK